MQRNRSQIIRQDDYVTPREQTYTVGRSRNTRTRKKICDTEIERDDKYSGRAA